MTKHVMKYDCYAPNNAAEANLIVPETFKFVRGVSPGLDEAEGESRQPVGCVEYIHKEPQDRENGDGEGQRRFRS